MMLMQGSHQMLKWTQLVKLHKTFRSWQWMWAEKVLHSQFTFWLFHTIFFSRWSSPLKYMFTSVLRQFRLHLLWKIMWFVRQILSSFTGLWRFCFIYRIEETFLWKMFIKAQRQVHYSFLAVKYSISECRIEGNDNIKRN